MKNACSIACALLVATASAVRADVPSTPASASLRPHPATIGAGLEINRLLRQSRGRALQAPEVSAGIARVGTAALPPVILILEERELPAVDGADRQFLSEPQAEELLEALRALPPRSVLDAARLHLEQRGGAHAPLGARSAVAQAVGTCGKYACLSWLCGLFASEDGKELEASVERTLASSVREILRRDREGLSSLAFDWPRLPRITLPAVVAAAGADGDPRALPLLGEVLVQRPDLARLALSELARQRAPESIPRPLLDELRARLTPDQPMECRAACNALAALGDFGAADKLVDLLSDSQDGIRSTAHQALQTLSAMQLPVETSGWKCWLAAEKAWFDSDEPALRIALESGSEPEAMDALARIAEHRWERHYMSALVARALERDERALRLRACQVLGLLSSPRGRKALSALAQIDDPELAAAARSVLSALPKGDASEATRATASLRD